MSIIYTLIARGQNTILVDYSQAAGNFPQVANELLPKIQRETQLTYQYNTNFYFHYINENNLTYMCLANTSYQKKLAFAFLEEIKVKFLQQYSEEIISNASQYSLEQDFSKYIKAKMEIYNQDPNSDKLNKLKQELYQVKDIMVENIDEILKREDQIEILVKKTTTMNKYAGDLKKQTAQVKRDQYWRSIRLKIFAGSIILAFILGFILLL